MSFWNYHPPKLGRCLSAVLILRATVLTEIAVLPRKPGLRIQSEAPRLAFTPGATVSLFQTPHLLALRDLTAPKHGFQGIWAQSERSVRRTGEGQGLRPRTSMLPSQDRMPLTPGHGCLSFLSVPLGLLRSIAGPAPSLHRASQGPRCSRSEQGPATLGLPPVHTAPRSAGPGQGHSSWAVPRLRVPTHHREAACWSLSPEGPQGEG